ncbi:MAG TPA: hypothetical protein VMO88_02110 [Acidimicrobiales bacterium]|nr:hypothetical protein [Acidimicrobiales bacterium]
MAAAGVALVVVSVAGCSSSPGSPQPAGGRAGGAGASSSAGAGATGAAPGTATVTTLPATTTTVDPGTLPQTRTLPTSSDPAFQSRILALWNAIVDGNPQDGAVAFFPLSAYIQVKGISDPVHDYQTRLIPNFDQDIETLHATVASAGTPASFVSVNVPAAAQWIVPGVEYNKGSYWRVYGTTLTYLAGGQRRTFEIHSLISWRGEWYVVHLGVIR